MATAAACPVRVDTNVSSAGGYRTMWTVLGFLVATAIGLVTVLAAPRNVRRTDAILRGHVRARSPG